MMGIYLQRSWIVDVVSTTILVPLFVFTTPIFRLFGEEEEIAAATGPIALWMIPIVYSFVFALTIQMFLQAQLKNMIVGVLSASSFAIHILLSWIFVNILDLGVPGAMGAYCISSWLLVFGEFIYVFGGWCPNTWKGFTKAAFHDIFPVIKLSISSGVMLCLELWYNSVLVLFAGYLQNATVAISAFSICLNICSWESMICLGFFGAACVRVSNELGRGNSEAAKFAIKVILGTSIGIGVIFFVLCLAFGKQISYIFTSNEEIAESVSNLSTLLAFSILLNSVQPVLSGVAVGAGFQGTVAFINIGSYYAFGVPVALLLGYVADLSVKGFWIGLLSGVLMQTFVLSIVVWRLDWDDQVKKASGRLNRWFLTDSEETN
ncbi:protein DETOXIFICATION 24-like [Alnus glutinosa]|uniref:protein DETOXIFICATION 24-like n=1 Tax=Alnus glutinosa TaxID=3517 RepID=UPI002D781727|nr:protein DETOXIFICATION 24-like [Alnus glutinosa]